MDQLTFEDYLISKKISKQQFEQGSPEQFHEFKELFDQIHPKSFTAQKLYLINRIRRQYPLKPINES